MGRWLGRRAIRAAVRCLCAVVVLLSAAQAMQRPWWHPKGVSTGKATGPLKAGEYWWDASLSPGGPVTVLVSLPQQMLHVYRNGILIGRSTVSTGTRWHPTPAGVFTILEKAREHYSKDYDWAPMPNMQRLTWSGVALHSGVLPGYPASHGCIRMPYEFSRLLFDATDTGGTVVIADGKTIEPRLAVDPGVFPAPQNRAPGTAPRPLAHNQYEWRPGHNPVGPVTILVSAADRVLYVYRHGVPIGRAALEIDGPTPLGGHVFTLLHGAEERPSPWAPGRRALRWMAVDTDDTDRHVSCAELSRRVRFNPEFATLLHDAIAPGATVVVTDQPASPRTNRAFTILSDGPERPRFDLVQDAEPACIVLAPTEHKGVMAAAKDLQRDITRISGVTPNIVGALADAPERCVVIGSADCAEGRALLGAVGVATYDLAGRWEILKRRVRNGVAGKEQVLALAGSDARGTIYGIYDFEHRHLDMDPLWFWADHDPPTRGPLSFDDRVDAGPTREPTWKYRGWAIEDPAALAQWMHDGVVRSSRGASGPTHFAIHPELLDRLWETALRLRMNMVTWRGLDIDWQPDRDRLRAAADRALFLTQHRREGAGVLPESWDRYWARHGPERKPAQFSCTLHPDAFREFWGWHIKRWATFSPQVVWEINLRGRTGRPYSEPSLPAGGTPQQRAEIVTRALADQARLVRTLDPRAAPEMITSLDAELGGYYDEGWITVPPGVTTGFCDAGATGMSRSRRFWTEERDARKRYGQQFGLGEGIIRCTPIDSFLKINLDAMHRSGDTRHMLLGVTGLRHHQLEIRAVAEMLWDLPGFDPREYLARYCREEFGEENALRVAALYAALYDKLPHRARTDGFKTVPVYYGIAEPLRVATLNLLDIESGTRSGHHEPVPLRGRAAYERALRALGPLLDQARALRPAIPEERRAFFDCEFIDAIRIIRAIYTLAFAGGDARARLAAGDRAGALAALLDARSLADDLHAALGNLRAADRWRNWSPGGARDDLDLVHNLYQKARLRLETDTMEFVTGIKPRRHGFLGNVVLDDPTRAGDAVFFDQAENAGADGGVSCAIVSFPLENAFQIGAVTPPAHKKAAGKDPTRAPDDNADSWRFHLDGPATVHVAHPRRASSKWLARAGFTPARQTITVGYWDMPDRRRDRPASRTVAFDLFSKPFPAGEVSLEPDATIGRSSSYIAFVQPDLLAFENFRCTPPGAAPQGWHTHGRATVVHVPDYDAGIRPCAFNLAVDPRRRPIDLHALRLEAGASAELRLAAPVSRDFVVHARLKLDGRGALALCNPKGAPVVEVPLEHGRGWRTVTVRVSPPRRRYDVILQDDTLRVRRSDHRAFPDGATVPVDRFRLRHTGDQRGSSLTCAAIAAWTR